VQRNKLIQKYGTEDKEKGITEVRGENLVKYAEDIQKVWDIESEVEFTLITKEELIDPKDPNRIKIKPVVLYQIKPILKDA
jgi:hypothetical protein